MSKGILIFGPNGAGKSTLAHSLAIRLGYVEMDAEDYYFPDQKASRLAGAYDATCTPFSSPRTKSEVETAILRDIAASPGFVLAGVKPAWDEKILAHIFLAVRLDAPLKERLDRIQAREMRRFGARTLPGGDMYETQQEFRQMVMHRGNAEYDESNLKCPVLRLDGRVPVEQNVEKIIGYMNTGA